MKPYLPIVLAGALFLALLQISLQTPNYTTDFAVTTFAKLPIQTGGRLLPMDTLARNSLRIISGNQTAFTVNTADMSDPDIKAIERIKLTPIEWLMDVAMTPENANDYPVLLIHNAEVLGLFGIQQADRKRFSFNEIRPHFPTISKHMQAISKKDAQHRSVFERELAKLHNAINQYHTVAHIFHAADNLGSLQEEFSIWESTVRAAVTAFRNKATASEQTGAMAQQFETFYLDYQTLANNSSVGIVPPRNKSAHWTNMGETLLNALVTPNGAIDPIVQSYGQLITYYRAGDVDAFNTTVAQLQMDLANERTLARAHDSFSNIVQGLAAFAGNTTVYDVIEFEHTFNQANPFLYCRLLYIILFVLSFIYMIWPKSSFGNFVIALCVFTFLLHTFGLFARMYIQNYPPVTNLYSSAIFIGWGALLLGILVERIFFKVIGRFISSFIIMVSSFIGFTTLFIAHGLAATGDTLEMMRAVLDSIFWLSTHVVIITLGYAATYFAGIIGAAYILINALTDNIDKRTSRMLFNITYGIICFAMLFSFVGTMLGGIWADQSWGRFWGWDPKENGALIIVLWCALMLHARWGGLVKAQGFMVLCVFGNIVTSWSWFGTNMLGIGLHSYGFMDSAFFWLVGFAVSQLAIMGVGMLPVGQRKGDPIGVDLEK